MSLSPRARHALVVADRTRDSVAIAATIDAVMPDHPNATLGGIDQVYCDATTQTYLIAGRAKRFR